ncbi:MAG: AMP-binding protein, partial [Pseudomonadota bacterium]
MKLPDETVATCLAGLADAHGGKPALSGVREEPSLSFEALEAATRRLSEACAAAGIGRGDAVLMGVADGPGAFTALLGISRAAIAVPVPPMETPESYARVIAATKAVAVVMDNRPGSALAEAAASAGLTLMTLSTDGASAGSVERPRAALEASEPRPGDAAIYASTSGATSAPKVIQLSHASFLNSCRIFAEVAGTHSEGRSLVMMPIAHLHSLIRSSMPVLTQGGEVVWAPGFDTQNVIGWLRRFRPTYLSGVPSILRKLSDLAEGEGPFSLKQIIIGSDRVTPEDVMRLRDVFAADVIQFYGL